MSIPKWKRRPSGLEYVDNAFEIQKEIMNLASKLSARWARIYGQPIDRYACLQADLVNMAYAISPFTKVRDLSKFHGIDGDLFVKKNTRKRIIHLAIY